MSNSNIKQNNGIQCCQHREQTWAEPPPPTPHTHTHLAARAERWSLPRRSGLSLWLVAGSSSFLLAPGENPARNSPRQTRWLKLKPLTICVYNTTLGGASGQVAPSICITATPGEQHAARLPAIKPTAAESGDSSLGIHERKNFPV